MKHLLHAATAPTLFGLGLIVTAGVAHADWQYSRWGMSPDAMVSASSGKARLVPDDPGKVRSGLRCIVGGVFQVGDQNFDMCGYFDDHRSLRMVALTIKSPPPGLGANIQAALMAKYGKPTITRSTTSFEWVGPNGGDNVIFYNMDFSIDVLYKPNPDLSSRL